MLSLRATCFFKKSYFILSNRRRLFTQWKSDRVECLSIHPKLERGHGVIVQETQVLMNEANVLALCFVQEILPCFPTKGHGMILPSTPTIVILSLLSVTRFIVHIGSKTDALLQSIEIILKRPQTRVAIQPLH